MDEPVFFPTAEQFRGRLARHHESATELLVGFWKVGSGRPSMTWPESADAAPCFGWIDEVRRRTDADRYTIRFTPHWLHSAKRPETRDRRLEHS